MTGINQSTLANTSSRDIVPSIQNLSLLCEAMGITLSQFFAEDESAVTLTAEEKQLLADYQTLPVAIRQSLRQTISCIATHQKN